MFSSRRITTSTKEYSDSIHRVASTTTRERLHIKMKPILGLYKILLRLKPIHFRIFSI